MKLSYIHSASLTKKGFQKSQDWSIHISYFVSSGNLSFRADVAKIKEPYLRLANKKKRLRWAKEHRHWTEELCLEGQHAGVTSSQMTLRLVFSWYYLKKLQVEDMSGVCFSN
jgi:lysozyme family protein